MTNVKRYLPSISFVVACVFIRLWSGMCHFDYKDRYMWASNICKGLLPYRDFEMLNTPLAEYYYTAFFKFSPTITSLILSTSLLVIITAIYAWRIRKITCGKTDCLIIGLFTGVCILNLPANYSVMSIMFGTMSFYYFYRHKKDERLIWLIAIALTAVLSFYSKQNTGAMLVPALGLALLIGDKKKFLHNSVIIGLFYLLFMGIGFAIFMLCGNFSEFIEYCFLSGDSFLTNLFSEANNIITAIGFAIVGLILISVCKDYKQTELGFYACFLLTLAYPLPNPTHLLPTLLVFGIVDLNASLKKATSAVMLLMTFFTLVIFAAKPSDMAIWTKHNDYKEAAQILNKSNDCDLLGYLENKDKYSYHLVFKNYTAFFYSLYLDRYDRYYDLFTSANFGRKTQTEVIKETMSNESGNLFIVQYGGQVDKGIEEGIEYINQNCILKETLYNSKGEAVFYVYQIP